MLPLSKACCISLLFFVSLPSQSANYGNIVVSRVTNVYDGDTFRVDIDQWPDFIGKNTPVRINNIDTPEIRGQCAFEKRLAQQAKVFTQQRLLNAKQIELKHIKRGKYFRIAADVYLDGQSLAQGLLVAGLARRYQGKHKSSWCEQVND